MDARLGSAADGGSWKRRMVGIHCWSWQWVLGGEKGALPLLSVPACGIAEGPLRSMGGLVGGRSSVLLSLWPQACGWASIALPLMVLMGGGRLLRKFRMFRKTTHCVSLWPYFGSPGGAPVLASECCQVGLMKASKSVGLCLDCLELSNS